MNEISREPRANLGLVMIIMGVQGQIRCFMENEKNLNSVLKDVLNVSIGF